MKSKEESFKSIIDFLKSCEGKSLKGIGGCSLIKEDLQNAIEIPIVLVDMPVFLANENGLITNIEEEATARPLICNSRNARNVNDLSNIKSYPFVYIYSISLQENFGIVLRFAEYNFKKKKVTFTISENIYEHFSTVADKMAINKSKFVENKISEFLTINK